MVGVARRAHHHSPHPGEAMISGDIVDQAALHGTLNQIRDLNWRSSQ
jgi:hypothetical protein